MNGQAVDWAGHQVYLIQLPLLAIAEQNGKCAVYSDDGGRFTIQTLWSFFKRVVIIHDNDHNNFIKQLQFLFIIRQ